MKKAALANINVEIGKGEFVFLVGGSGSGKSTFLKLILREFRSTTGRVFVAGKNVGELPERKIPALRREIGMVSQDFRLLPGKSVFENVAFALQVIGKSKSQIRRVVPETLELVGLGDKGERRPDELSGGEQQRVVIARALLNSPDIILADEPTGNLDPETGNAIVQLLHDIVSAGTTVIMSTHNYAIVQNYPGRIIRCENGQMQEVKIQ
ncbi:MAG: ATP-binding cassette domain-containing protein [Prevotella sp.]|jgi:cell division transport system ATP-binding protein|nr:ATP-binding cassette domain-containing protein [Prevotella sp.]